MKTNHRKVPCTANKCNGDLPEIYCSREILDHAYIPAFITLIEALNMPLMFYMVKPQEIEKGEDSRLAYLYIFLDPRRHPFSPKELAHGAVNIGCKMNTLEEELEYFADGESKDDFMQICRRVNCPQCSKRTYPQEQWALKGSDFFGKVMRSNVTEK